MAANTRCQKLGLGKDTLDHIQYIVKRFVAVGSRLQHTSVSYQKVVRYIKQYDGTDIEKLAIDNGQQNGKVFLRFLHFNNHVDFGFTLQYDSNGDIVIPADLSDEFLDANGRLGGRAPRHIPDALGRFHGRNGTSLTRPASSDEESDSEEESEEDSEKETPMKTKSVPDSIGTCSSLLESKSDDSVVTLVNGAHTVEAMGQMNEVEQHLGHGKVYKRLNPSTAVDFPDRSALSYPSQSTQKPLNIEQHLYDGNAYKLKPGMTIISNGQIIKLPNIPVFHYETEETLAHQVEALKNFNHCVRQIVEEYDKEKLQTFYH